MSRPKWHEAWQESFDEGFSPNPAQGAAPQRKAVSVRRQADGTTEVLGVHTGAEAERLIAKAEAEGVEVLQDAEQVDQMIQQQGASTGVPPEVYELMNAVISFAQELGEEWKCRQQESLLVSSASSTEFEYTLEDVK